MEMERGEVMMGGDDGRGEGVACQYSTAWLGVDYPMEEEEEEEEDEDRCKKEAATVQGRKGREGISQLVEGGVAVKGRQTSGLFRVASYSRISLSNVSVRTAPTHAPQSDCGHH